MTRWWALLALAAGCSGLTNNDDGIATLEVSLPTNLYLEKSLSITLHAVARNSAGDSVDADVVWRTPDTTVTLDSAHGTITALQDAGTARVQVAVFGQDTLATKIDALLFTLTPKADTLLLTGADSLTATVDTLGTAPLGVRLMGGTPLTAVRGRPITFRIIDPAPADSPRVVFSSNRIVDSAVTTTTGSPAVSPSVRGVRGRTAPDRAVVEINAYRANGALIPGSRRRVVIRFLHQ